MKIEILVDSLASLLEDAAERVGRSDIEALLIELREHDDSTLKRDLVKRAAALLEVLLE